MARFYCEAMDATGGEVRGLVEAELEEHIQAAFRRRGYFVTLIHPAKPKHAKFRLLFSVDESDVSFHEALTSHREVPFDLLGDDEDLLLGLSELDLEDDDDDDVELGGLGELFHHLLGEGSDIGDSSLEFSPSEQEEPPREASPERPANSGDLFERSIRLSCFVRGRLDAWAKEIAAAKDGEFLNALSYTDEPVAVTKEFFTYTLTLVSGHWSHVDATMEIYVFSVDNHWMYAFWKLSGGEAGSQGTFAKRLNGTEANAFRSLCGF